MTSTNRSLKNRCVGVASLFLGLWLSANSETAGASMIWNESVNGDLSNNGLAPTSLVFTAGSNQVQGSMGNAGNGIDRDYFTFVVPEGMVLSSLILLPGTFVSGGSAFLGIQAGPQLTVTPTGGGAENLLGFTHYDTSMIGFNLLPNIVFGGSQGLGSGAYSVWVQETGGGVDYSMDFRVTPVPLPGAAVLMLSGLAGLVSLRRRTRREAQ